MGGQKSFAHSCPVWGHLGPLAPIPPQGKGNREPWSWFCLHGPGATSALSLRPWYSAPTQGEGTAAPESLPPLTLPSALRPSALPQPLPEPRALSPQAEREHPRQVPRVTAGLPLAGSGPVWPVPALPGAPTCPAPSGFVPEGPTAQGAHRLVLDSVPSRNFYSCPASPVPPARGASHQGAGRRGGGNETPSLCSRPAAPPQNVPPRWGLGTAWSWNRALPSDTGSESRGGRGQEGTPGGSRAGGRASAPRTGTQHGPRPPCGGPTVEPVTRRPSAVMSWPFAQATVPCWPDLCPGLGPGTLDLCLRPPPPLFPAPPTIQLRGSLVRPSLLPWAWAQARLPGNRPLTPGPQGFACTPVPRSGPLLPQFGTNRPSAHQ